MDEGESRERSQVETRRRIVGNFGWLVADKGLGILNGLVVGAVVARYLGPSDLGVLANASAIGAIVMPLVSLGFDPILLRDAVQSPDETRSTFWTMFWGRTLISLVVVGGIGICIATGLIPTGSTAEQHVLLLTVATCLLCPLALVTPMLESAVASKYRVWNTNLWAVVSSAAKLCLVYWVAGVESFAVVNTGVAIAAAISLAWIVCRLGLVPKIDWPSRRVAKTIFKESWPLVVMGLSVSLYMHLDVSMLRFMSGSDVAGKYSVAVKISSLFYFLPVVLASTLFPTLARLHHSNLGLYQERLLEFMRLNVAISYVCVVGSLITIPTLIAVLFGSQYSESISLFRYHIFALPFVFLGVARSQHLILEKQHRFNMLASIAGGLINVLLNLLLIPLISAKGAALATIASYGIAAYASSFFFRHGESLGRLQTQSLIPLGTYRAIAHHLRS